MRNNRGFTLMEVILSLMIVGIMGAVAGMGIVTGTRGYLQTAENTHMAQKAQVSMARIYRELMELTNVAAVVGGADPYVIFDNPMGRQAIAKVGDTLQLYALSAAATDLSGYSGDILVNQVAGLSLSYFKGAASWTIPDGMELLSAVHVNFDLQRKEGSANTVSFSTTVYPRNTNNFGGAPPTAEPMTAPQYECFIAAAAAGKGIVRPDQMTERIGANLPGALIFVGAAIIIFLSRIYHEIAKTGKRRFRALLLKPERFVGKETGNVLVGLIVTMLIFAALGAGMLSLTSTSTTSQVAANSAARAYYIAESGFRYAASEYLNTVDGNGRYNSKDEKNGTLEALNGTLFTLAGGDEKFRIDVYPYYLTVAGDHMINSVNLQTKFSGQQPSTFAMPLIGTTGIAKLKINDQIYIYTSYNPGTGVFSLNNPAALIENVYNNATVELVGVPSSNTTLSTNGNLMLAYGAFFPEIQGKFLIDGVSYAYIRRNGNTLENITDANDPTRVFSFGVGPATTDVVMAPFVQARSTATVGQGELEATREIVYNTPLPTDPEEKTKIVFHDDFADDSNLNAATYGSFSVTDIGGDSALKVTSTADTSLSPKSALISFNWTTTNVNFASAHKSAGRFLSYDAQTKVGIDAPFTPTGAWDDLDPDSNDPEGLPKYFMSGIAFRLDENLNAYGLGFTRGSATTDPTPDNIAQEFMSQDQVPMIVLWQQVDDGATQNWLAYSILPGSLIFSDDIESGPGAWTANGTWAITSTVSHSETNCWTDSPGGDYAPDQNTWIESEALNLSGVSSVTLAFWHRYDIDSSDSGTVEISLDGGTSWDPTPLATFNGYQGSWVKETISDTRSYSASVKFRFRLQTDSSYNDPGWWIDDIKILNKDFIDVLNSPLYQGTLMVRITEAAIIDFTSGGTTEIVEGDKVTQPGGAIGTVAFPPVLESGTWAGGNATGMLWLNNTSSIAFTGGDLNVLGKGSNLATVTLYKERTNLIKAYYNSADPADTGPSYDDPYDNLRLNNPRGTLKWPADEGEPTDDTNDHFTLLEWDIDVNDAVVPIPQRLKDENGKYTIIAIDTLFSPEATYFPYTRPELGLFSLGHGAIRTYFDDLGVQLYVAAGSGFLTPVQQ